MGTRLRPITDTIPKPLIPFHNRPFLSYLLEQVRSQGIREVVLLVGYLGDMIREYCGDGKDWDLSISYSESPVEAQTGQRLREAASLIAPHFLLMYCDNYWPMDLKQMWQSFRSGGSLAMVTAYANRDGYTRSNLRVDEDGYVAAYDPKRTQPGLNGVEIGYALMSKEVLEYLPDGNVSFEHTVYPALSAGRLLKAFQTEHRYYSVGSHERLPLTESFLKPQLAVILDRDGVLNERPPIAEYVKSWEEFQWLPDTMPALQLLRDAGYKLLLASNQSGIARGVMTESDLAAVHRQMNQDLAQRGISLDAIYYCPHGWDDGCSCRKPLPGMLFQAQRDFHLDLTKTLFIGDDERDQQAGQAAGCLTDMVTPDRSLTDVVREYLSNVGVSTS
ncbi:MAG: HAD-IIIA family hydrolase [Chloroflexi bacterium]|nr:HAD-IIIA family hydrolase [Chloroflexota bacterium]